MNEVAIEKSLNDAGKTGPRVTPKDIDANIVHVEYVEHLTSSGKLLRWALLTTKSGYIVTGDPSVCVSPENDIPEIGRSDCFKNAREKLWALMGYHLQCQLSGV